MGFPASQIVRDLTTLQVRGGQYGTIDADPPWRYDRSPRGAARLHYPTRSLDAIAALPVASLAADVGHLHLWTTHSFLLEARAVLGAWGFSYQSLFVWVKPQRGTGYYWRGALEVRLLGVNGRGTFRDHSIRNWICCDRGRHSAKPAAVRALIERVSPPPYLELFGRRPAPGWTVFGNQIQRGLFDAAVEALD